jgi:aldehyde dehydrogenase (NAD+)
VSAPYPSFDSMPIGRFGGKWAIDEFTTGHWVSVQHQPRDYAI